MNHKTRIAKLERYRPHSQNALLVRYADQPLQPPQPGAELIEVDDGEVWRLSNGQLVRYDVIHVRYVSPNHAT